MPKGYPNPKKSREQEARPEATSWLPPSVLPDPTPQDGVTFRYIRASTLGEPDPTNVSRRYREGWVPCKIEDHPELHIISDPDSRWAQAGNVEIGGLVLCKIAKEQGERIKAYYDNRTAQQERATSTNYMRGEDPRMPLINERKRTVTFGSRNEEQ
jgi:hypothetical protein